MIQVFAKSPLRPELPRSQLKISRKKSYSFLYPDGHFGEAAVTFLVTFPFTQVMVICWIGFGGVATDGIGFGVGEGGDATGGCLGGGDTCVGVEGVGATSVCANFTAKI